MLIYMEDMRVVDVEDVARCLGVDHTTAFGMIHAMTNRGWARRAKEGGWQLSSAGWLLASAESSDTLELTLGS